LGRQLPYEFDPGDFSFAAKRRGGPLKLWVWKIYRAGRSGPVERSAVFFETMAEATKGEKKAHAGFLAKWAA
jgi:hypothetical protein